MTTKRALERSNRLEEIAYETGAIADRLRRSGQHEFADDFDRLAGAIANVARFVWENRDTAVIDLTRTIQ